MTDKGDSMDHKGKPPMFPVALAGHGDKGGSEYDRREDRLNRYGTARDRARQMLGYMREHEPAEEKRIALLRDCGEYLVFNHYFTQGLFRLVGANFCKQGLLCPLCAIRRGAKQVQAYLDRLAVVLKENPTLKPFLVTFTVTNGPDLLERFNHLQKSLQRLHDRRRDYFKKGRGYTEAANAQGAVWSFEVTNREKGWHPHVHAIWLCEDHPNMYRLREEWKAITGDSFMVDVRQIEGDPAEGFVEVFKYALKFSDLTLAQNVEAWRAFQGRRLVGSFGAFRGVDVPASLLDEHLDALPFVRLFYRYLPGVGYSLTGTESSDNLPSGDLKNTSAPG
jgi:hypothetical protein